ncbi:MULTISPECIES: hypothetical protein [Leuconostoc]|uniref:hypothetical protein n=1 Tax=Leuconostoc TaxID=1243 RepID=UPI00065E59B6|nr:MULTISPECIES: hypothetical protein [Leuconostoc]AKP36881.1 hypothetical protein NH16_08160 [Leuconostoc mesenteroides subsp. dextranicum]MBZ1518579.1 hypothetical protein [Leuconostoc mesenteroides]MBZ1521487.1 hypothetical protein [Leuconostoc mesenteroides]MBZ1523610.1 hypothetical protein [Leuconostoc mesenteroides]MCT3044226.1 hypothetical protein [Leuconostoc mesenteroides]
MANQYNVFIAVDFFNADILFVANSSGELSQKVIKAIENHKLESDGAVRLYRTSYQSFKAIENLMVRYHLPFHEAARPKGRTYESQTTNAVG